MLATFIHWVLPNHCYLCGTEAPALVCVACETEMRGGSGGCHCCALPLPENAEATSLCGDCMRHPKPFTRTLAAFRYAHPIDFLINRFKHHRHFRCGTTLSEHLLRAVAEGWREELPDALLPMPLHWSRRWVRGFNQSDLIAYYLGDRLGIPIWHCARRLKRNPRQQSLSRTERLRNLRQAFAVSGDVKNQHIALVDDVMTTGATVTELARCLLAAGAARVDVWVLARVP